MGKNTSGRGNSKDKGPEIRRDLTCTRNMNQSVWGGWRGNEVEGWVRPKLFKSLYFRIRNLILSVSFMGHHQRIQNGRMR